MNEELRRHLDALESDPEDESALNGLEDVLTAGDEAARDPAAARDIEQRRQKLAERGEWPAVTRLLELELLVAGELGDEAREVVLTYELAKAHLERLHDVREGLKYLEKVVALDPAQTEAADMQEKLLQLRDKWQELVDHFAKTAENETAPELKTSLFYRSAETLYRNDPKELERVRALIDKSLAADPCNQDAIDLFTLILRRQGDWSEIARLNAAAADAARSKEDRLRFLKAAARLYAARAGDHDKAAELFREVLAAAPSHPGALAYLADYYDKSERWDDLVTLYEDALRGRPRGEAETAMLLQIGMVHWRRRNDLRSAEEHFHRLRKSDPTHQGMLQFYRELCEADQDWIKLLQVLGDAQRAATDPADKLELSREIARLADDKAGTATKAIDSWKQVLRLDPTNAEAREALRRLYGQAEQWNALLDLLKGDIEVLDETDVEGRVAVLRQMVTIYRDKLLHDQMVINTFNGILRIDPDNREALEELSTLYENLGRYPDLTRVLERRAEVAAEPKQQVALLGRVARLWVERFNNLNKAVEPLEKILEIDGSNTDALSQLKGIYEKRRAWKPLYEVLRREADLLEGPERLERLAEVAKLAAERLDNQDEAIEILEKIYEASPDRSDVLDELERLTERQRDWAGLARVLERRIAAAPGDQDLVPLLVKAGAVYGDRLDDPARSAEKWRRVIELQPGNPKAVRVLKEAYVKTGDFAALEELYGGLGDWEGLVEVLSIAADQADRTEVKVDLSFKAARVYEERIEQPGRAQRSYERVLAVEPSNERAARALVRVYEESGKWPRLLGVLKVLLEHAAPGSDERLDLLVRMRDLSATRLGEREEAFRWAAEAYKAAPERREVRDSLEHLAGEAGAWTELIALYDARGARTEDDEERLELVRRVARLLADVLGRPDEAVGRFDTILELRPGDPGALASLERIYTASGRFDDLLSVYRSRLEGATDDERRCELLREMARIHEEGLDDADSAAALYREVLELRPEDQAALAALERMALESERWAELARILERRRELAGAEASEDLTFRIAELLRHRLEQPARAVDELRGVLEASPGHSRALDALEPFLADPDLGVEVATLMEPHLDLAEDYPRLGRALTIILEATPEPDARVDLQKRLATLQQERLLDAEGAMTTLGKALALRPADRELWERLELLADAVDAGDRLAEMLASAYRAETIEEGARIELAVRLAAIYDTRLGRPEAAREYHEHVLASDVGNDHAFESLESLFTANDAWDDLLELYGRQADRVPDAEDRRDLLLKMCFIYEEVLEKADEAIEWYGKVLEIQPDDQRANDSLETLFAQTERWRDLAALLEAELGRSEGDAAVDLRYRLGELHEARLDEPSTAIEYYSEVLRARPTHLKAQEALERFLGAAELRQRAAAILEPIYEAQGASPELVRVLEVQLEELADPPSRVQLLRRIGALREKRLGEPLEAFLDYARAFDADPADPAPREELRRLADEHGLHERHAAVLERGLQAGDPDVMLRCELLSEVAGIYERRLDDRDKAEDAYRRLLDADPDNPETALPAARALEQLYLQSESWPKLVETLRLRARFAEVPEERRELLLRVAEIQEAYLDLPADAIATFDQILEALPDDLASLHALERLHERTEGWAELVAVLRRRIELTGEAEERRELHFRVARLFDEKLENVDDALLVYHAILTDLGPDREATRALVRLYDRTERWVDLLDALEQDLALSEDPDEQARLLTRMGNLHRDRLEEPGRAVDRYREVMRIDSSFAEARGALEGLLADEQVKLEAARVLAPIYESEGAWPNLVSVLELEAREAMSSAERLEKLRQAAEVAEVGLEDPSRAFDLLCAAFRDAAGEPQAPDIVETLERLANATARHSDLVQLYRDVSADVLDGELQLRLMLRVAGTAHRELADLALAREYYVKVLETFGDHDEAMDALEEIYRATAAHTDLLDIYRRKSTLAVGDDERRRLLKLQAELCEVSLEDLPQATSAYESILDMGEDREAMASLERLYAQAERWTDLSALLERRLAGALGEAAVDLRYRLGELHRVKLEDPDTAIDHYRAALQASPRHADTVAALETLMSDPDRSTIVAEMLGPYYKATMSWPKLVGALEARLRGTPDPMDRKPLLRQMGTIYEEYLEDLESAFETYARMFRDDLEDAESRDLLGRLAGVLDAWPKLAGIYAAALDDVLADTDGTAELAFVLAGIHDERCEDRERARDAYRRVLAFDPDRRDAFEALEGLLTRMEAWPELLGLHREAVDRALEVGEKKTFLFKMATTQEEKLEDRAAAIELYREVLDLDERDERAIASLDRLFYYEERWEDLADLFLRRIEQAEVPRKRNDLRCQLGGVYEERLKDLTAAVDAYEAVLEADTDNREATRALERLVMNEEHRFRISKILEPVYEMHDEWMKLVVIYDAELDFIADQSERVRLRREIARLHEERGGDLQIAFDALAAAFAEEPSDQDILAGLQRLAEQRGSWEDFVVALEKGVETSYDGPRKAELLRLVARTQDRRLGDPRAAIEGYRRLLEVDETDEEALDALEGLYTLVGDWDGQIETLERKAVRALDPSARKELLHRVGAIYEDMVGQPDKAVEAYTRAYVEDDSDLETLSALDRLYEQGEAWNDLVDILRRRLDLATEQAERVELHKRVAVVFDSKLDDELEATQAFAAVLRESPRDQDALEALDRLHTAAGRWPELLDVLQIKSEVAEDTTQLVAVQMRIGGLLEKELLDLDRAVETYRAVLAERSDHEDALAALERIALEESHRFAAAEVLEPLLRKAAGWERLTILKELKLKSLVEPGDRVAELRGIAEVREDGLGDVAGAFEAHVRALAEAPSDEDTHGHLERLADRLVAWDRLAAAYETRAAELFDPAQVYDLNVRLGRVREERLGESGKAIAAYRRALDAGGGDEAGPLAALDRLYLREESWKELAEVLEREMAAMADGAAVDLLELRLGDLRRERFSDLAGAIAAYRSIVERNPAHDEALAALEQLLEDDRSRRDVIEVLDPLYRQRGDDAKLASLYRVRVRAAEESADKVPLLTELATLLEQQLRDEQGAFDALSEALRLEPSDPMLLGEIERLAGSLGAFPALVGVLDGVLAGAGLEPGLAKELGLRAARIYDEKLGDSARAEERYRGVLAIDRENAEVLRALESLVRRAGGAEALVPVLRQRAEVEYDLEDKKRLYHEAAAVARERLGDPVVAAECYEAALQLDENDASALDALAAIREEQGRWKDLAELLSRRAQCSTEPAEGVALRHRVATLQAGPLEQPDKAIETYREIVDFEPADRTALGALERLLGEAERWVDLQDVLQRQLEAAEDDAARVAVLLKKAGIAESRFESVEDALEPLRSVLDVDPDHPEALAATERLLVKDERFEDLVELLDNRALAAASRGETEAELRLLVRIGEIWERQLHDRQAAVEIYERVLARQPEHTRALGALARLHEAAGDWDRCAEALEKAAASGGPDKDMAEIRFRLGKLNLERRQDREAAESCFVRALELDGGHEGATEALMAILTERGDHARIAELLERRLDTAADEAARVALLRQLGEIHLKQLGDAARAVPFLEQARAIRPKDTEVLVMLVDVYIDAGKQAEAVPLLQGLIDAEVEAKRLRSKELAVYRQRLGRALEASSDFVGAKEQYEQAYKIDIGNVDVLASLGLLHFRDEELDKAMKVFRGLLLQRAESTLLTKADIYARIGDIHVKQGDPKKALGMYQRGLDTDPGHADCKRMVAELKG